MTEQSPRRILNRRDTTSSIDELGALVGGLEWLDTAACRNLDIHHFFPPPGRTHTDVARRACDRCRVRAECAEYVKQMDIRHGFAAGVFLSQRR